MKNGQSRDTGNIGHVKHKMKTNKAKIKHNTIQKPHKKRHMDTIKTRSASRCSQTKDNQKSLKIPKGVIRIRKSKDSQHNGQKTKDNRTNNDLQNINIKLMIE